MILLTRVSLLLFFSSACSAYFNLEEIEKVKYSVSILDTPLSLQDAENPEENILTMVNKFGQKYQCLLPGQEKEEKDGERGEGAETVVNVKSLLAPLHTSPCLIRTKDWWTYEVCFGRRIRQYHMENDRPVGVIMDLGTFDLTREGGDEKLTYHPEWYTNGSRCDLTGLKRESEVRFVCDEAAVQEYVGDIFEPKSCEYTILIHTAKICSVPHLRPTSDPVPLDISCKPVLPEETVLKYNQYTELKAKKDELTLQKMKERQAQLLRMFQHAPDPILGGGGGGMESIFAELGSWVDSALTGPNDPTMKIIDLKEKLASTLKPAVKVNKPVGTIDSEPNPETGTGSIPASGFDPETDENVEHKTEQWNLVNGEKKDKHGFDQHPAFVKLQVERNEIWIKTHENQQLLKKFISQFHDTITFLQKNLDEELKYDAGIIEKLEVQKKQLEKVIEKTRQTLSTLKRREKDVNEKLKSLMRLIMQLNKGGGEDDDEDLEQEIRLLQKEMDKDTYLKNLDVIKDDMKLKFPDIMKDAMQELGIQDVDIQQEGEAMAGMEDELNTLLQRLGGAEVGVEAVQQQLHSIRTSGSLKRDGKKSVKKELREDEEGRREEETGTQEIQDTSDTIQETKQKLQQIENTLNQVEERLQEKKKKLMEGIDKIGTEIKVPDTDVEKLKADELVKSLESTIKKKLEKLGLDTMDRPIEVKVITTRLPMGDAETGGPHYEGMMHNLIHGNTQGYQDIDSQWKAEKNYQFSWDDSQIQELQEEIYKLETEPSEQSLLGGLTSDQDDLVDTDVNEAGIDFNDVLEEAGSIVNQMFGIGEQRTRPSSVGNIFGRPEVDSELEDLEKEEELLNNIEELLRKNHDELSKDYDELSKEYDELSKDYDADLQDVNDEDYVEDNDEVEREEEAEEEEEDWISEDDSKSEHSARDEL